MLAGCRRFIAHAYSRVSRRSASMLATWTEARAEGSSNREYARGDRLRLSRDRCTGSLGLCQRRMSASDVVVLERHDHAAVERLLRALPDWFGMEEALLEYVRHSASHPTYLAYPRLAAGRGVATDPASSDVIGILVAERHFPAAAEIHLMAVDPSWHRQGVGRSLLEAAEAALRADGVRHLQVKTLGPTDPDPFYARTRQFYAANGFDPLEENHDLWPGSPCLLMIKTL